MAWLTVVIDIFIHGLPHVLVVTSKYGLQCSLIETVPLGLLGGVIIIASPGLLFDLIDPDFI